MRPLLPLLLVLMMPFDLDINVPPGSPLEWNRQLPRPVPTMHRGGVPTKYSSDPSPKPGPGGTQTETPAKAAEKPPPLEFMGFSFEESFAGTSADCFTHLKWGTPPKTKPDVTQDDVATEGGFVMTWNYPPAAPAELIWVGLSASIREKLHPGAISWPELAAYCLEIGEPALLGAEIGEGKITAYLKAELAKLPPKAPIVPRDKDPYKAMLLRLAAVEMSGGYPQALDPTFSRRTLALGKDALPAIIECTQNAHTFLARNATSVLAACPYPEATPELIKLWKDGKDAVVRIRALRGLADRGEKSIVDDLILKLDFSNFPMQIMIVQSLGRIGDPKAGEAVLKLMRKKEKSTAVDNVDMSNMDLLWTAVPALSRMRAGKETLLWMENKLMIQAGKQDETPVSDPFPPKLLRQMCCVGLALMGEKRFQDEIALRVEKFGLESFHPVVHYQLIEALATTEKGGEALKKVLDSARGISSIRVDIVRALVARERLKPPELKELVLKERELYPVRGRALQFLAALDAITTRDVCRTLLTEMSKKELPIDPGRAFLFAVAAQAGGIENAFEAPLLVDCVEKAYGQALFARREGNNDVSLLEMKIKVSPPLLETLVIELGRTGSPAGFPILKAILEKKRYPQGRAEAAFALGAMPGKETEELLVDLLEDKDGWVRFAAYKSLLRLSKQDHFRDWIFGDPTHRAPGLSGYKKWFQEKHPK